MFTARQKKYRLQISLDGGVGGKMSQRSPGLVQRNVNWAS
jgi:hypothetical protein